MAGDVTIMAKIVRNIKALPGDGDRRGGGKWKTFFHENFVMQRFFLCFGDCLAQIFMHFCYANLNFSLKTECKTSHDKLKRRKQLSVFLWDLSEEILSNYSEYIILSSWQLTRQLNRIVDNLTALFSFRSKTNRSEENNYLHEALIFKFIFGKLSSFSQVLFAPGFEKVFFENNRIWILLQFCNLVKF